MINFTIYLEKVSKYVIYYDLFHNENNQQTARYRAKISVRHNGADIFKINTPEPKGKFTHYFPKGKIEINVDYVCDNVSNIDTQFDISLKKHNVIKITANTIRPIKLIKPMESILLIIDSIGWAFDNISKNVKKYSSNYDITIITYPKLYEMIKANFVDIPIANHILFFWYGGCNMEILDYFYNKKSNKCDKTQTINLCIYDYSKWVNTTEPSDVIYRKSITYFFNKIDNYLYGCNFIKAHVEDIFKNIIVSQNIGSYKIFDGVDTSMFPYFGYGKDILTKDKLIVGWIGNSNPTVHGINKGFNQIKKTIESLSSKFIFLPLDIYVSGKVVAHEHVHCYLSLIDIIVCYSMYEGTPNQILEASSCGKCWISTNVGIVDELQNTIANKPCGIVINRTENELASALESLYDNRNLIIEYGNNGRKAIDVKWSWEKKSEQFYDFFDEVSKGK